MQCLAADLLRSIAVWYISVKKRRNATNAIQGLSLGRLVPGTQTGTAMAIDCFRKVATRSSISEFPSGFSFIITKKVTIIRAAFRDFGHWYDEYKLICKFSYSSYLLRLFKFNRMSLYREEIKDIFNV